MRRLPPLFALITIVLTVAACDAGTSTRSNDNQDFNLDNCTIPTDRLIDGGVGRNGIPSLQNPSRAKPDQANYLADSSRVIGLTLNGETVAVPHNILWWHEIANLEVGGQKIAVSYCPLTGSSLAFDRSVIGGNTFGVSGLLFNNNLVMFDRTSNESLWPQMNRQANCGPSNGTDLSMISVVEMRWDAWRGLHPNTDVLSNNTGFNRNYRPSGYPYGDYERINNDRLLFDIPIDERRPPKERLLGIPSGEGGLALPFGTLDNEPTRAIEVTVGGEPMIVFWDRDAQGTMAYHPTLNGRQLSFSVQDGRIVDDQTGSTWTVDGRAVDGPQSGTSLEPVRRAYVAFWFAWAVFQPETDIWGGGAPR